MNKILFLKNYFLIILLFFLLFINKVFCKNIELIHVDSVQKNEKFLFLIGKIHLKYNEYHIFCDKAIYYKKINKFYGYGKVKLISKKSKIFSKKIEYISRPSSILRFSGRSKLYQKNTKLFAHTINFFLKKKLFQAINHVIFYHNNIKLKTNILEYDLKSKKLFYKNGAFINYNKLNIYSKKGIFYENKKKVELKDGVKIFDKNYIIYSNAIEYSFQKKIINFYTTCIIKKENNKNNLDSSNNFISSKKMSFFLQKKRFIFRENYKIYYNGKVFIGNFLIFDQKKRQISFNHLSLINKNNKKEKFYLLFKKGFGIFDLNKKFLFLKEEPNIDIKYKKSSVSIHADVIKIYVKKNFSYLIHILSVKNFILNKYIKVKCKLLIFDSSKKKIKLFGNPVILIKNEKFDGKNFSIDLSNLIIN
ncbi:OstA-like protein [Blattabacterium cuenoti]|uniref:OstA-like protein n=1 Tax=Blattabacterium cuenoti TaxID=1653831 RepID=UPI00163C1803|nr:OstA-like protein [Blattabacterium cuenoti]